MKTLHTYPIARFLRMQVLSAFLFFCISDAFAQDRGHALIIGIGQYSSESGSSPLLGIAKDLSNARKMALAMGIPNHRIQELRDTEATKSNIIQALNRIKQDIESGERVFIYFSGHGTRYSTPKGCKEGLVPYTPGRMLQGEEISETELAQLTSKISEKADKAIVMIDSCFSGGLGASATRSLFGGLEIRSKFTARSGQSCNSGVNEQATRSFLPAMQRLGQPEQNFVQISAANYNEVSWDSKDFGGLATHNLAACLLGEAKDLNRSGAVSLDEIRQCAQGKLNAMMVANAKNGQLPSTIQVRGSRNLIVVQEPPKPVLAQAPIKPTNQPMATPVAAPAAQQTSSDQIIQSNVPSSLAQIPVQPVKPPSAVELPISSVLSEPVKPEPTVSVSVQTLPPSPASPANPLRPAPVRTEAQITPLIQSEIPSSSNSGEPTTHAESQNNEWVASAATLEDIHAQRNARLKLEVVTPKKLKIAHDTLSFSVKSNTDGYLYAVMLGSDRKSFYLLYPNKLDQNNKIKANVKYNFPKNGWSVKAGGPKGTNHILFVVSQSPRDARIFTADEDSGGGLFTYSLTEMTGRKRLIDFFLGRGVQGRNGQMATSLVQIEEIE